MQSKVISASLYTMRCMCDRQPVQRVAECRRDVLQSDVCDEPGSSVKHRLKAPNDLSSNSVKDSIAVVDPTQFPSCGILTFFALL
jgi:hypothetical protein